MTEIVYPDCIRELYESEIFGEAASLATLKISKNARDTYHHATLLQLETETKARLRPFLYKYGIDLSEDMDLSDVDGVISLYLENNWKDYVAATANIVQSFLARFEAIVKAGPEEDKEVLLSMVRHEKAILSWAQSESQGPSDTSLDAMIAQLRYPLAKPDGI